MIKSVAKLLMNAKIVQKAVLERQGKILLIKRSYSDDSFAGWWDLPGGNVDKGENIVSSIVREVTEETKLNINPSFLRAFYLWVPNNKYLLIGYATKNFSGELHLSSEHPEFTWVALDQASHLRKVQPIVKRLLRAYFKLL